MYTKEELQLIYEAVTNVNLSGNIQTLVLPMQKYTALAIKTQNLIFEQSPQQEQIEVPPMEMIE